MVKTRPTTAVDHPGNRRRAVVELEKVRSQFKYEDIKSQEAKI